MTTTTTLGTPDDVSDLQGEGGIAPPMADNSPTGCDRDPPAPSPDSDTRHPENGRWHDVAKLLVFIWAVFSSLAIGTSLSVIPYANPAADGLLWTAYTAVCTLAPWAVVLLVWRWPTIGAFALLAGFVLWLVFASRPPQFSYWACVLLCPALLTLPPAAAIALHLRAR